VVLSRVEKNDNTHLSQMQEAQTMFTRQMHETKKRTDVEKYPFAKKPWGMSQPEN